MNLKKGLFRIWLVLSIIWVSLVVIYLVTDIYEGYKYRQAKGHISVEDAKLWLQLAQNKYSEKYDQAISSMSFDETISETLQEVIITDVIFNGTSSKFFANDQTVQFDAINKNIKDAIPFDLDLNNYKITHDLSYDTFHSFKFVRDEIPIELEVIHSNGGAALIFPVNVSALEFTKEINTQIDNLKKTALQDEIKQISPVTLGVAFLPQIILLMIGSAIFWAISGFKEK